MKRLYQTNAYTPEPVVGNYWNTTADSDHSFYPPLDCDTTVDVAIIGAGFTGLNAALQLATEHQLSVCVLDAAQPGWGASGRNGGFVCLGGVKQSYPELIRRFGLEETRRFRQAQLAAIETVADNLVRYGIDAERHSDGEWELAHRPDKLVKLREEAAFLKQTFAVECRLYSREDLAQLGLSGPEFHGAMHIPFGFAINPRKYIDGLLNAARQAGIALHGHSEVTAVRRPGPHFELQTAQATVRADRLIVATNGYSADDWIAGLSDRYLPVLSNIIVTRPLTDDELAAQGWTSDEMAFDTRTLLHYFRLLPNRRFLFGMRGGTSLSPAAISACRNRIRRDFERMFPAWREAETPYYWSGLACLSRDLRLYVGPLGDWQNAWTALAFHGNGVAMGSYSGRLLAGLVGGTLQATEIPAVMRGPLRRFPFPQLRLAYLKAAYLYLRIRDEYA